MSHQVWGVPEVALAQHPTEFWGALHEDLSKMAETKGAVTQELRSSSVFVQTIWSKKY